MSTLETSQDADDLAMAALHAARVGDGLALMKATNKLEWLFTYAGKSPSAAGFGDLMHVLRMACDAPIPSLVSRTESGWYDPATQRVTDQSHAAEVMHKAKHSA